jgi:FixJ family two-component response regulator
VVVIDDDLAVRTALGRLLRSAGYAPRLFASAEAFLGRPNQDRPDCLVLDVDLPGASGFDLMRALAAAGRPPPVVFITGHADQADGAPALADEPEVLLKPFDGSALLDAVARAVRRGGRCAADATRRDGGEAVTAPRSPGPAPATPGAARPPRPAERGASAS